MQLPAPRMVRRQQHPRSFAERIAERSPKFRVFDLLKSQPNRLASSIPALARAFTTGAMVPLCLLASEQSPIHREQD